MTLLLLVNLGLAGGGSASSSEGHFGYRRTGHRSWLLPWLTALLQVIRA